MYLAHFGFKSSPFSITPQTASFFAGAQRGALLDGLLYAVVHGEGIVKVSGEVGSGKTMLCRMLLERLPEHIQTVYLANPSVSREGLLLAIADELQVEVQANRMASLQRDLQQALIKRFAQGQQVVVVIDEAHAMPKESLEEIRLLSNLETGAHKLLQIVLFGQPELDTLLAQQDMRQLRERITHHFSLPLMTVQDIEPYLAFRAQAAGYVGAPLFSTAAAKLLARASHGLARRVNILADKALLACFAENAFVVDKCHAKAAIADAGFLLAKPRFSWMWGIVLWCLGCLLGGGSVYFFMGKGA